MDGAEFDSLTRSLIVPRSRRGVLATLLGSAVSAVAVGGAIAKKKKRNNKRRKRKNDACCTGGGCCEGTLCRPGVLQSSCGADGQPCADCTATAQRCIVESRTCGGCDPQLCAQQRNGCCAGDQGCLAGNDEEHCGSDGKGCQRCLAGERCRVAQFSDGVRRGCCAPSGKSCAPLTLPCCPGEGSTCLPIDGANGFTCCAPEDVCNGKCCDGSTKCDASTGECVPRGDDCDDAWWAYCLSIFPDGACTTACGAPCCVGLSECSNATCESAKLCGGEPSMTTC